MKKDIRLAICLIGILLLGILCVYVLLVDKEKELARLEKELTKAEKEIAMLQGKLANEKFVSKAPANIIEAERTKLAKAEERKAIILETMEKFR